MNRPRTRGSSAPSSRTQDAPGGAPTVPAGTAPAAAGDKPSLVPLLFDLISLTNIMRSNQEHFARYIGTSVPRFLILRVLEDAPGATVSQVAARLEVTSQFVTVESGKLIEQGMVAKRPSDTDRRSVVLDLTPRGQQLLTELRPLRTQTNEHMFRSLSPQELELLRGLVARLLADGRDGLHRLESPAWRDQRAPSLVAASDKTR